jgi:hypothetical protein
LTLHHLEKVFAAFCVLLAAIALAAFWPPTQPPIIAWLVFWCGLCLLAAYGIVRRARYAPAAIWGLTGIAILSAMAALRDGMLDGIGILIDVVLFVPMIGFAIWYQRRRGIGE